jgi:hypothetical protein
VKVSSPLRNFSLNDKQDLKKKSELRAQPLLFLDVNLGQGGTERVVIREGDTAENIARAFCQKHGLDNEAM